MPAIGVDEVLLMAVKTWPVVSLLFPTLVRSKVRRHCYGARSLSGATVSQAHPGLGGRGCTEVVGGDGSAKQKHAKNAFLRAGPASRSPACALDDPSSMPIAEASKGRRGSLIALALGITHLTLDSRKSKGIYRG